MAWMSDARKTVDPGEQLALFLLGAHRLAEDVAAKTGCDGETALCEVLADIAIIDYLERQPETYKTAWRNGACLASYADFCQAVTFPDGSTRMGSVWTLENGSRYAAVDGGYYALDGDSYRVSSVDGQPVSQGLAPESEDSHAP